MSYVRFCGEKLRLGSNSTADEIGAAIHSLRTDFARLDSNKSDSKKAKLGQVKIDESAKGGVVLCGKLHGTPTTNQKSFLKNKIV